MKQQQGLKVQFPKTKPVNFDEYIFLKLTWLAIKKKQNQNHPTE